MKMQKFHTSQQTHKVAGSKQAIYLKSMCLESSFKTKPVNYIKSSEANDTRLWGNGDTKTDLPILLEFQRATKCATMLPFLRTKLHLKPRKKGFKVSI